MSRENAQAKGRRYLVEGRLTVERVDGNLVIASCRATGTCTGSAFTRVRVNGAALVRLEVAAVIL